MRLFAPCLMALALLVTGCGGIPPEADAGVKKAAAAFTSKDKAAIAAVVVPSQRTGALGLSSGLAISGAGKKTSELTLDELLDVEFFSQVKSVTPDMDRTDMVDDNTAHIGVMFDFGDTTIAARSFVLKKEGDAWLVDIKATLDWWEKLNGSDALSAIGLKK
ncbi:MAG: hypothetical protein KF696_04325 [Planctomycetes bacterium]|nr:hypothetical protein [Planctomycetota bacterium]MCW8134199.1 hypothetical protein [Planctomycetota bacterium]